MKYFVWLATLSLLILGIYCTAMIPVNQPVQAAMFSEGSFPSPDMHQGSPAQLAAERGEGAYPTPCPPNVPCLAPAQQPKLQAGEGAYPTPCPPNVPCLAPAEQPKLQAGEGAYPTPCPRNNPCLAPAEQPKLQAGEGAYPTPCPRNVPCAVESQSVALLGDGATPTPYELPGGMN